MSDNGPCNCEQALALQAKLEWLRDGLIEFGAHATGCPGWYRAIRSDHDPAPPVKTINDPCNCGYALLIARDEP